MGDRVSISFSNRYGYGDSVAGEDASKLERDESPVLFCHWGGMDFVNEAYAYARQLKKEFKGIATYPLGRLEPGTVMVDFIRHITKGMPRVEHNLYLGCTAEDGDNSDNGHFTIELDSLDEEA